MSKSRLERIFIRVKDSVSGRWGNKSIAEATDEEFDRWFGMYMRTRFTDGSREACIMLLDDHNASPVEIKEGAFEDESK